MTSLSISNARIFAGRRCAVGIAVVLSLVVVADWLFYRQQIGISAALFMLCVAAGVVAVNPIRAGRPSLLAATAVLIVVLVPLAFQISFGALVIGAIGVAVFSVMVARPATHWTFTIAEAFLVLVGCFWRAMVDICTRGMENIASAGHAVMNGGRTSSSGVALTAWVLPVGLGALFLALFAAANPMIEGWLTMFDLKDAASEISAIRILLWVATLSAAWSFIFVSRRHSRPLRTKAELEAALDRSCNDVPWPALINSASILRSLILFNALFAVQTVLDLAYLWGGVALPAGMSYAAYAHRGAYPLVIAALLAAGFVLIALRPGSESERSPLIRKLVYLWTAQTLLLVISSILRLDLYVEAYSLTYLRAAAFVWMILVAIGLILIAARIMFQRSNLWLITGNVVALALAIYVVSIVNLPAMIAHYNVQHSRELSGEGVLLDVGYVANLGPQAIPALDLYLARYKGWASAPYAMKMRHALAIQFWGQNTWREPDWRAWTWWDWRLGQYLKANSRERATTMIEPSIP